MLRIAEYISEQNIAFYEKAESELEALITMVKLAKQSGNVIDESALANDLLSHEILSSSAKGCCAVVFRVSSESVLKLQLYFAHFKDGIGYFSKTGHPIDLIFLAISPLEQKNDCKRLVQNLEHLLLHHADFREKLRTAQNAHQILQITRDFEKRLVNTLT